MGQQALTDFVILFSPQGDYANLTISPSAAQPHLVAWHPGPQDFFLNCALKPETHVGLQSWYWGTLGKPGRPGRAGREAVIVPVAQLPQKEMHRRSLILEGRGSHEGRHQARYSPEAEGWRQKEPSGVGCELLTALATSERP